MSRAARHEHSLGVIRPHPRRLRKRAQRPLPLWLYREPVELGEQGAQLPHVLGRRGEEGSRPRLRHVHRLVQLLRAGEVDGVRNVYIRLPGTGCSKTHGARMVR